MKRCKEGPGLSRSRLMVMVLALIAFGVKSIFLDHYFDSPSPISVFIFPENLIEALVVKRMPILHLMTRLHIMLFISVDSQSIRSILEDAECLAYS